MYQEEKHFVIRLSLEAQFSEDYEGEEDNDVWLRDWDARIKPELLKTIFSSLRQDPVWMVHVRNRGAAPTDEIEIALVRKFSNTTNS